VIATVVMDFTSNSAKIIKSISLGRALNKSEEVSDENSEVNKGEVSDEDGEVNKGEVSDENGEVFNEDEVSDEDGEVNKGEVFDENGEVSNKSRVPNKGEVFKGKKSSFIHIMLCFTRSGKI
jgi:anti-sigma factor ChrR (cupin superfamily)